MKRLGQSTMNAALLYQHATSKRDREIAEAIEKRLLEKQAEDEEGDDDGSPGVRVPVG